MNNLIQGFLDNDSFFGRFMTKLGIIIAANIMFVLLSIPFFTIGAGFSALYYVLLIAFLLTDIRICKAAGGALDLVKIGVYALGAAAVIIYLYLIPVMTVFRDTLPHLIRNAVYFLIKKPWKTRETSRPPALTSSSPSTLARFLEKPLASPCSM